jgi:hypothetical protein
VRRALRYLLCTATGDASGKLSDFITTNRAVRHNFGTRSLLPPPTPPPPLFGSPPGAQVYLSQVGFHILSVDITIFPLTICFVIQLLHSLTGHDGGLSSHQNVPTPRDSNDHSNQPSINNT